MPDNQSSHQDNAQASGSGRGILKIFLGYAPGVGKTLAMLDEAHRRKRRGQDVVIGHIDLSKRKDTAEHVGDLDVMPTLSNGEVDVNSIIARKPGVVVIDDLEHENAAGSDRPKRWQDVDALLAAGIAVLTTVSVVSLESLNDQVRDITGLDVTETIPDQVLHSAEEIELVDLTPRALINRLERGDVLPLESLNPNMQAFFREGNLAALREIAMREAAGRVDEDIAQYRRVKNIEKPWATADRVMVCISPNRNSLRLIRKGWRVGQRLRGEVVAVHVDDKTLSETEQKILRDDFALAQRLGIRTVVLKGNVAEQLIGYAKENSITQILLGHPEKSRLQTILKESLVNELVRALRTVDITLVAAEQPAKEH